MRRGGALTAQLTPDDVVRIAREFGVPRELMDQLPVTPRLAATVLEPSYSPAQVPGGLVAVWDDFDLPAWLSIAPHLFVDEGADHVALYGAAADTLRTFGEGVQVRWSLELAGRAAWIAPKSDRGSIVVSELCCLSTPLTDNQLSTVTTILAPTGFGLLPRAINVPVAGHSCVYTTWWPL